MTLTSEAIKRRAREIGFDLCGIAAASSYGELGFFRQWIARGYAGEMRYLARTADKRAHLRAVLPSARSVIVCAIVYNTRHPYSIEVAGRSRALISRYAWGDDYHDIVGQRLDELVAWLQATAGEGFEARRYVDTGPIQERVFAQYAGIGWIGKNTCVIHPALGSWLFLGEIICNLPLDADAPAFDQCGTCTLCLEACPTGAIVGPHVLDATRCISYLTIERRGAFSAEEGAAIGSHVYGCDICQDVCPWNQQAAATDEPGFQPRPAFESPTIASLEKMTDAEWRRALGKSPMKRAKLEGLRRNLRAARENAIRKS